MQSDLIEKRPVATGYPTTDVGSPSYRQERAGLAEASLRGTLAITRRAIVRNAKREDVFFFLLPAALIYSSALPVSAWDFIRRQENLNTLSAQTIIGFLLIIFGLIINIASAFTLRQFYSSTIVIKEGHQLMKHGIYNLTRHPIYLGSIMASMGVPIFVSSL